MMLRSLRGRLTVLLVLLIVAALTASVVMIGLFRQSADAQLGRTAAENGRACDAISNAYGLYAAQQGEPVSDDLNGGVRSDLLELVHNTLSAKPGVQGGIWQAGAGSMVYAYPTYSGAVPQTEIPQGELPRVRDLNRAVLKTGRAVNARYGSGRKTLLVAACPVPGRVPGLTAWTMTWTYTTDGRSYRQLMAGLAVLLATVLTAVVMLGRLAANWSRHVARIEKALRAYDLAGLPVLPATREEELDRIVLALNEAGQRLAAERARADDLARSVATAERLAAIGRVAAGVAHEIRNPIASMRLKAESALAAGVERQRHALEVIVEQVDRLDTLVRRLLSITQHEPQRRGVELAALVSDCAGQHAILASQKDVEIVQVADEGSFELDPLQIARALDNLVMNAIQAAPRGSRVIVAASATSRGLVLSVTDGGVGPPADICDHLFEPFVTGRADGTGLGLSIVREVAEAHGGEVSFTATGSQTCFLIVLPWPASS
jgi:signal transduction histidine kinase